MGSTPISVLAGHVANRLEENTTAPVFWSQQFEFYSALIEAQNDLLLLVGRPNVVANQPFTIVPNTVWQTVPSGMLMITDIVGASGPLYKTSLYAMDYIQSQDGSSWENTTGTSVKKWGPIGFGAFFIWPAVVAPVNVLLTSINWITSDPFPYTGNETVPFHDEQFDLLEMYAAHYCRLKEAGMEFEESLQLYQQYLAGAQRLSSIEDRRDPDLFSRSVGARLNVAPITKR